MKRNLDLQTKILQLLEKKDEIQSAEGYSQKEFGYNARQLESNKLITIIDCGNKTDPHACIATGLTPKGHDLLDKTRTEWSDKAKSAVKTTAQTSFDALLRAAIDKLSGVF